MPSMTPPEPEYVEIDGHRVLASDVDRFYNMNDGSRVTDEQWDEETRRRAAVEGLRY